MNPEVVDRPDRKRLMLLGCAMLALITIAAVFVRKTGGGGAMAVACIYGGGTLAMALLTARATTYPRWAWFASAGVIVLTLVVAALLMPSRLQVKEWSSTAWMMPWWFLVSASSPARASGVCATRGPLLVGVSVVFSGILLGACWLTR
jgi:hypothetical protein